MRVRTKALAVCAINLPLILAMFGGAPALVPAGAQPNTAVVVTGSADTTAEGRVTNVENGLEDGCMIDIRDGHHC